MPSMGRQLSAKLHVVRAAHSGARRYPPQDQLSSASSAYPKAYPDATADSSPSLAPRSAVSELLEMLSSETFLLQLGYGALEVLLVAALPELKPLFQRLQHGGLEGSREGGSSNVEGNSGGRAGFGSGTSSGTSSRARAGGSGGVMQGGGRTGCEAAADREQ